MNEQAKLEKNPNLRTAYLAGGCFWGLESYLAALPGVVDAVSGYANGRVGGPVSYEEVCRGITGYKETVRVVYDPAKISLDTLLFAFFRVIDPSEENRQGNDIGEQYQTGIFYESEEDGETVRRIAEIERGRSPYGFYTLIEPLTVFWEAEEYHQDYLCKHPNGYCHIPRKEIETARALIVDASPYRRTDDADLRPRLNDMQFAVVRRNATEPPFDNEYYTEDRRGLYVDIATAEPLFSSRDKFDCPCGWPAFAKPIDPNVVVFLEDDSYGMHRTEVRSRAGDSHLGHVFEGEAASPTGLRYCINSAALRFVPFDEMDAAGYGSLKEFV